MSSAAAQARLLLVQAQAQPLAGLKTTLEHEGYEVVLVENGATALELIEQWSPHLVLTELALPVVNGFVLLKTIRESGSSIPVIVLADRSEEADCVVALRLGADDVLSRPYRLLELLERIKIRLRSQRVMRELLSDSAIRLGEAVVDQDTRMVRRGNRQEQLRPREFDVFSSLLRASGAVVTKEQLLNEVWGFECQVDTRRVDFQVTRLRKKIENDPAQPRHLLTVRGVGYRLLT